MDELTLKKDALRQAARTLAGWKIIERYSTYKQLNLIDLADGYTEQDRAEYRAYRDAIRAQSEVYEAAIEAAETLQDLDAIVISYEAQQ